MWLKLDDLKLDARTAPVPPEEALPGLIRTRLGGDFRTFVIEGKSVDARRGSPQIVYRVRASVDRLLPGMEAAPPPPDPDESELWRALKPDLRHP